jgi:hypothetical protein
MAVKAVNDTTGSDGLVLILLVFGAYPRISHNSPPSPTIIKRAEAIRKAMAEVRKLTAFRQVSAALNARNGPDPAARDPIKLPLQSEVRVWRKNKGWQGPYKVLAYEGHNVTLELPNGPTNFRSTIVASYFRGDDQDNSDTPVDPSAAKGNTQDTIVYRPNSGSRVIKPRKRGRPKESRNKKSTTYISAKESSDHELAIKLRKSGVITAPGLPFEKSDNIEVINLIARGIINFVRYNAAKHESIIPLFKSRIIHEIKGKNDKPYEKLRWVIQGYNDRNKKNILTQSFTIQRISQRLIITITMPLIIEGYVLELRDITQAYPQSSSELKRKIFAKLPKKLRNAYPSDTIIQIIRPLYGIAESGVY